MKELFLIKNEVKELELHEQKKINGGYLMPPIGLGIMLRTFEYYSGIVEGYQDATQ
ncbi:hypothetical protein NC796_00470 [Aliifodinibius sp. S!AR15-10]|uniref:hypothetical protein n=1 Tax=Aliifodinibius sp. S!AR15-10 TaxID=2950437 RepID=UPI0028659CC1|nr:hypothetical protein [Aliifodinibius sp. S!AR15-10]MDR8389587.1 hypothetical protein [Aliifodinibius sp. S!AR15-10]